MKHILLSLFLLTSLFVNAQDELLPADKAFAFKAEIVDDKILLNWDIAKGYYLYKEKIKIVSDHSQRLGEAQFPIAKIKNDEFFGKVGVYRDNVLVSVPVLEGESKLIVVNVEFQGCADLGVCYPPMTRSATLKVGSSNKSLIDSAFDVLSKTKSAMQSIVDKTIEISDEPLPADRAFSYSVSAIDTNTLRASWKIHPEYYLYHDKFFIDIKGAEFDDVNFPKGEIKEDEFFGKVEVHKGEFSVDIPLTNIQSSQVTFIAKFQGCWLGGICYPPVEKSTDIALSKATESSATDSVKTLPKSVLSATNTNSESLNETDKITALLQQDNILWILVSFFGFGLLLSLTPCVFPMIPILSGIIVGQKGEITTRKALIMSIVFVLAMSVTYSMAGVLAGYFGENLQVLFQTPWVLMVFSAIFVALAFSMFGYYEIQLPSGLQNKITNISNKQEGGNLIGVAIMGFLSALIVGPCVAPPLAGALIYIGQTGDAVLGGLSLFVLSLGMGAPLLLVGAGVSKLPKAGGWMDNVKYVFGILMLAVAIYLLDRIITPYVSLILWASLFTLSPIAMGALNSFTSTTVAWQRILKGIGLLIVIYGVLLWGLVARGGGDMLAPLAGYGTSVQAEKAHIAFEKIKSSDDLDRVLAKAQGNNQIVMLDFYADWCISCKELERFVFSNVKVVSEMKNVIALQADVTANDATDKALMARFSIIGPPGILFFKAGVENRSQRIVGEINAQDFLKHLNNSK
ncbi:Cytochrome c-type biogenesis protein DsbD, protein-disulfide reductase (EC 1.8.1.8) [uncultured Gammaproteobacteria bacterium]|jgi:thiol:disulfide interchange protein DsbD|uniref:Thiol:disulfide interchange protein DsbD n=3 Tax=sulfur-oxidizing symbionts TaxID=32036 RepID=A0A1H6MSG9_9GAMM|nr:MULTISPECIES: protein-disulfide reductase DsbD [sulfur-oxidizing symbionts]CAC5835606.1 Cytochrome c-type biogenesis protein DsbD, protein-disulfide reductase (EC 1.8.1.8) [uncultured Gammaproteobacteria bacterium]CAB5498262.1 Cytochrome c-type biogenesis protein DsbD, protein-disulfide reductase (EC [Bathymodiolus azoricus thioautotrophic gill symbiont]CAB5502899.1 Cytochrome c-type biogenesis protein DsbD, protein-disulfide reductase (EC [Bathymodiolus thermophilus thioautotrophic gill symb